MSKNRLHPWALFDESFCAQFYRNPVDYPISCYVGHVVAGGLQEDGKQTWCAQTSGWGCVAVSFQIHVHTVLCYYTKTQQVVASGRLAAVSSSHLVTSKSTGVPCTFCGSSARTKFYILVAWVCKAPRV